ncbi:MAG: hypothetical protein A2Z04_00325 [Chloroflexi bacterium RBG_16_57_9]|nr:MAG: hypothetical protein A2Z04_00325 [Chloroflexi bacterium RBG_16_57_9]
MKIKVLGTGCYNCIKLEALLAELLGELKLKATVERVDDPVAIERYMAGELPGLVIDEVLVCESRLPGREELKSWLIQAQAIPMKQSA